MTDVSLTIPPSPHDELACDCPAAPARRQSRLFRPLLLLALAASGTAARQADAQTAATVTVNASAPRTTIPATAFGLNTAVWNGFMTDAPIPSLYKQAGISALRYPGGSTSDVYH